MLQGEKGSIRYHDVFDFKVSYPGTFSPCNIQPLVAGTTFTSRLRADHQQCLDLPLTIALSFVFHAARFRFTDSEYGGLGTPSLPSLHRISLLLLLFALLKSRDWFSLGLGRVCRKYVSGHRILTSILVKS